MGPNKIKTYAYPDTSDYYLWNPNNLLEQLSAYVMRVAHRTKGRDIFDPSSRGPNNPAQSTYLLNNDLQKHVFLKHGYIQGKPNDYGLVQRAVGNRNLPVYQRKKDSINRENLTPIGNMDSVWLSGDDSELEHAGSYPTAIYRGNDGKFYQKAWDLNDYGDSTGRSGVKYKDRQFFANMLDKIGSPTVVTTGYQPIEEEQYYNDDIQDMMRKKGLYPIGENKYGLPEIFVTPYGNKIIAPRRSIFEDGGFLKPFYSTQSER